MTLLVFLQYCRYHSFLMGLETKGVLTPKERSKLYQLVQGMHHIFYPIDQGLKLPSVIHQMWEILLVVVGEIIRTPVTLADRENASDGKREP